MSSIYNKSYMETEENPLSIIGNQIKLARIFNSMTQSELAEFAQVNHNTIYRIENGMNANIISLIKISDALALKLKDIL